MVSTWAGRGRALLVVAIITATSSCKSPQPRVEAPKAEPPPKPEAAAPAVSSPRLQTVFEADVSRFAALPARLRPVIEVTPVSISLDPGFEAMELRGPDGLVSYRGLPRPQGSAPEAALDASQARQVATAWLQKRIPQQARSLVIDRTAPLRRRPSDQEEGETSTAPVGYVVLHLHRVDGVLVDADYVLVRIGGQQVDGCELRLSNVADTQPPSPPGDYLGPVAAFEMAAPAILEHLSDASAALTIQAVQCIYWSKFDPQNPRKVGHPYDAQLSYRYLAGEPGVDGEADRKLVILVDAVTGRLLGVTAQS